jgi:hypothetical protein
LGGAEFLCEVKNELGYIQTSVSVAVAAFKEFQREVVTRLDALQADAARERDYAGTHSDSKSCDGPASRDESGWEPNAACMPEEEQLVAQYASRGAQQEYAKACILIQAWWRMCLVVAAVRHCISVKGIKVPARRCKALDCIIDKGMYRRHMPVIHDLFVRLRSCYRSGKARGTKRSGAREDGGGAAGGTDQQVKDTLAEADGVLGEHLGASQRGGKLQGPNPRSESAQPSCNE